MHTESKESQVIDDNFEIHIGLEEFEAVNASKILMEPHRGMFPAAREIVRILVQRQLGDDPEAWVHLSSHEGWKRFFHKNRPFGTLAYKEWRRLQDSMNVMVYAVKRFLQLTREKLPATAKAQLLEVSLSWESQLREREASTEESSR